MVHNGLSPCAWPLWPWPSWTCQVAELFLRMLLYVAWLFHLGHCADGLLQLARGRAISICPAAMVQAIMAHASAYHDMTATGCSLNGAPVLLSNFECTTFCC